MTNSLTYFPVSGSFYSVSDPSISGNTDVPVMQPINALVTFTARLPRGQQIFISDYLVTAGYNALQTINLLNNPTGGTFTLDVLGVPTGNLAWDITPAQLQTALENLSSVGAGNVIVTSTAAPATYSVEFTGDLGNTFMAPIVGDASLLLNAQGAGYCEITVTTSSAGSDQVVASTAISLPPLTARIYMGVLSTIDYGDTPGFNLVANTPVLGLTGPLIYDVTFDNVTFNGTNQVLAPFAFTAPVDNTAIDLTDPGLALLPYEAPQNVFWSPSAGLQVKAPGNWRQRRR